MTVRGRLGLFAVSAAGLAVLLLWGLHGLHPFGDYQGPYGDVIAKLAPKQRHMANTVTALVFDYRGFDTMGEETLLFAAASAVGLLMRTTREGNTSSVVDAIRSDAIRAAGAIAAVMTLLVGIDVVAHGFLTPGGGFQGGVILAASLAFLFLGVEYRAYADLATQSFAEPLESFGVGGYVGLGLISFAFGLSFLENFLGAGVFGRLSSGGSALLVNWASGFAVAGGFLVIFSEYLEDVMGQRHRTTPVEA